MQTPAAALLVLSLAAAARARDVHDVEIHHFAFSPRTVEIFAGSSVRWTNYDAIGHTATSQTGPGTLIPSGVFDSGELELGGSSEHTFDQPGTFHYWCVPHGSSMQGVVIVLPCPADLTGDALVDFADYLEFLNLYTAADPRADLTGDALVDFLDYLEFLNRYEAGC